MQNGSVSRATAYFALLPFLFGYGPYQKIKVDILPFPTLVHIFIAILRRRMIGDCRSLLVFFETLFDFPGEIL